MNKNYIFTALLLATILFSTAQTPPAIQWQKCLGGSGQDQAYSIKQTFDSGYIVAGSNGSNDGDVSGYHGAGDCWIVKLNKSGTLQWQKSLGSSGTEVAYSIEQTSDSGYIVAAISINGNDGDVSGNHGIWDYWIVKLNSSGDIQWQKSLGGSREDFVSSIGQTSDGGYIVAGYSISNDGDVSGNHGEFDCWIVKLNSSGIIQWQKSLGGSNDDEANSIEQTSDGGYIVAGYSISNDGDVSGHHGLAYNSDYWIVKLNPSGIIEWQKSLGGSDYDWAFSIKQTSDGGYIVAGYSNSNDGDVTGNHGANDYWIVKLNSSGTIQWQKSLGGSGDDYINSIEQTSDGGYIAAGYSGSNDGDVSGNHGGSDYWIVKLDGIGNIQWQKSMGGSSYDGWYVSITPTFDNGYIVAGSSISNDGDVTGNHGDYDYWVVKLEPDDLLPVTLIDFSGEVNGKQNLLHWTTATEQNNTGFEIQRSSDGYNFNKIGFVNTKAVNGNSNLKINYDFSDFDFVTGANYYRLKQIDKDGKYDYSNIVLLKDENVIAAETVLLYPNPVRNILNVKIASTGNKNIIFMIMDISGKLSQQKVTRLGSGESIVQLDVSHLSAGTYFLKMIFSDGSEKQIRKFIKE